MWTQAQMFGHVCMDASHLGRGISPILIARNAMSPEMTCILPVAFPKVWLKEHPEALFLSLGERPPVPKKPLFKGDLWGSGAGSLVRSTATGDPGSLMDCRASLEHESHARPAPEPCRGR